MPNSKTLTLVAIFGTAILAFAAAAIYQRLDAAKRVDWTLCDPAQRATPAVEVALLMKSEANELRELADKLSGATPTKAPNSDCSSQLSQKENRP